VYPNVSLDNTNIRYGAMDNGVGDRPDVNGSSTSGDHTSEQNTDL